MLRKVEVLTYDERWVELFADEAENIRKIMEDNLIVIHHFGSTSVPGLAAKPVIDLLGVVQDINIVDSCNKKLAELGYTAKRENGIPGRRYFQKGGDNRSHHLHIYQTGSGEIHRHIVFRDYLRAHPDVRDTYGELKRSLSQQFPYDIGSYIAGKEALAAKIQRDALEWSRKSI